MTKQELFGDIDFKTLADIPDFKEASVREFIISPILNQLGFKSQDIILEKGIQIQTGSKKQLTTVYADYVLKIDKRFMCVIEAKAPQKNINSNELVEQAFSYASHNSIRSNYFALCNGIEFALYKTDLQRTKLLQFQVEDIEENWEQLEKYISQNQTKTNDTAKNETIAKRKPDFDYLNRKLLKEIPVKKRAVKRYYGCNAYFTRQSWNVVQAYINNFSQQGDLVLDPFSGSGITGTEAIMIARNSINVDINPLAVFINESLIAPVNLNEFLEAFEKVKSDFIKNEPKTKEEYEKTIKNYKLPKDLPLPKESDVSSVWYCHRS